MIVTFSVCIALCCHLWFSAPSWEHSCPTVALCERFNSVCLHTVTCQKQLFGMFMSTRRLCPLCHTKCSQMGCRGRKNTTQLYATSCMSVCKQRWVGTYLITPDPHCVMLVSVLNICRYWLFEEGQAWEKRTIWFHFLSCCLLQSDGVSLLSRFKTDMCSSFYQINTNHGSLLWCDVPLCASWDSFNITHFILL